MSAMVATAMDWGESLVWRRFWGLSLASWVFVGAGLGGFVGLLWDGAWHASWGRDTFFIPPHDLMYGGVSLAMVTAVAIVVSSTRRPAQPDLIAIGPLQAPLGVWVAIVGMLVMFSSAAYDDWWHTHIGHVEGDPVLWSPPHFIGSLGAITSMFGALLFVLREAPVPLRADGKPVWFWERLNLPALGLVLCFCYIAYLVSALTMDRFMIYDKLRFDGSVYPLMALTLGPAVLVLAQRVTNRAGVATFAMALGFFLAAAVAFMVKDLFGFPKAASLPIMALFGALFLDLLFKRFGKGYKWLVIAGPVFVLIFYVTEYLWAWYLTRYPWWPIMDAIVRVPLGIVIGTASLLFGAWLAARMDRAGLIRHINIRK